MYSTTPLRWKGSHLPACDTGSSSIYPWLTIPPLPHTPSPAPPSPSSLPPAPHQPPLRSQEHSHQEWVSDKELWSWPRTISMPLANWLAGRCLWLCRADGALQCYVRRVVLECSRLIEWLSPARGPPRAYLILGQEQGWGHQGVCPSPEASTDHSPLSSKGIL